MPWSVAAKPHLHTDQQQAAQKYRQNHQKLPAPLQLDSIQEKPNLQKHLELHYASNQQDHQFGNQEHAQY